MKRISIAAAMVIGSAAFSTAAFADPTGGTTPVNPPSAAINIGLTVVDECTIAGHDIDFGTTGLIPNNIDTSTTVDIECTKGTDYAIGLDDGIHAAAGVRKLKHGSSDLVTYDLYSDSGYGTTWGNVTGSTVTGTGVDHAIQIPLYARIAAGQNVPTGAYSDLVTATIWYAGTITDPDP